MVHRLKVTALWVGGVFVMWVAIGVTWRWRSYEPSGRDLLLGLVGVPVLVIAGYLLLKRVLSSMLPQLDSTAAMQTKETAETTPRNVASTHTRPRLLVLGGCVKLPAGGTQELMQACAEGVRPGIDAQLRDAQGFPVMAARVAELDDTDAQAWWDSANLDTALPWGRDWFSSLSVARARELRLLIDVLVDGAMTVDRELLEAFEQRSSARTSLEKPEDMGQAPEVQSLAVHVRLSLPSDWGQSDWIQLQSLVQIWLKQALPTLHFDVQMHSADAGQKMDFLWPAALFEAKRAALMEPAFEGGARGEVWLLAAAHSDVSQSEVDRLEAMGRLYGPKRREGWIVGEGAAALVVLRLQPEDGPTALVATQQSPVIAGAQAVPAAEVAGSLLPRMLAPMLESCGVPAAAVMRVLSDADHRSGSAMEAAMLLSQQLPALSLEKDCTMVGVPSGYTAGVAALASLVLAAEFAVAEQQAALAVALASASGRAVALLMPPGWTATEAADGTAAEPNTSSGAQA